MDLDVASEQETLIEPAVTARAPRRQWGSDTRVDPLPAVAPPASDAMMALGRIAIVFTILAWLSYVFAYFFTGIINSSYQNNIRFLSETIVYVSITSVLALSALLYLVARQGALYRTRAHRRVPRAVIDELLRHDPADDDRAGAVLPRGSRDGPQDAAVGGAAGVPVPAGRAAARRPAQPDVGRAPGDCCEGARRLSGRADGVARRAARAVRRHPGGVRDVRVVPASEERRPEPAPGADPRAGRPSTTGPRTGCGCGSAEEVIVDHVDRFFADQVLGVLAADFAEVGRALTDGGGRAAAAFRGRGCCSCTAGWPGRSAAS